ncbi:MAG: hypothetical protein GY926_22880 [bacterium]|nr:hypothetical protein [bacterium]
MRIEQALGLLDQVNLPTNDYAIFGSGPLLVRGVINDVNDLDLLARGAAWETATAAGQTVYLPEHDITVASFFGGLVTVGNSWAIGDVDVDKVIDTAETLEDFPFARLEHVVAYKTLAGRTKDMEHLRCLEAWRNSRSDPDH